MYLYFTLVASLFILLIDWYFYRSAKIFLNRFSSGIRKWWIRSYWIYTGLTLFFMMVAVGHYITHTPPPPFARSYITGFIMIVFLSKLSGNLFFLIEDLRRLIKRLINHFNSRKRSTPNDGMSRASFLKKAGIVAAATPFVSLMYGVVKSAFDYQVIKVQLPLKNLPSAFNGLKILQISDIHTGSFISKSPLCDAVKMINQQKADLVVFTGDLVNEVAEEALPYLEILKDIQAPLGVYSILGNHDYGDYFYREDEVGKKADNKSLLIDIYKKMGWKLLLNEHVVIEKGGQQLGIIGVENWGAASRFQKYGDLEKAKAGTDDYPCKILLSHDPSHWDARVIGAHDDIDLTLSGHTHGFQMGVEIPGFIKWSPSQYLYEQWSGLYQKGHQYIYVNKGLGFLGYPGRLGMLPEITLIELQSSVS